MSIKRIITLCALMFALASNLAWAEQKGLDHFFKTFTALLPHIFKHSKGFLFHFEQRGEFKL